jgi:hypothetical protein
MIEGCECHDFEYSRLPDAVRTFTELLQ